MAIRKLTTKEKLSVFKKLANWCLALQNKGEKEILNSINKGFSPTTLYHIYGSLAIKSTAEFSRASSTESMEIELPNICQEKHTEAEASLKRTNEPPTIKSKKTKLDKTEIAKKFLKDFSVVERPKINHIPIDEEQLKMAERCDDKDKLVNFIKTNLAKLNASKLDLIQIRLVIARQFKKLRELFGARKPNKEFEDYFKENFELAPVTFRYYINYLQLLEKYRLFQFIPHSFRLIRTNIGILLDWLDSDEAKILPVENNLSQLYWKRCPAGWNVLPREINSIFMPVGTTHTPNNAEFTQRNVVPAHPPPINARSYPEYTMAMLSPQCRGQLIKNQ